MSLKSGEKVNLDRLPVDRALEADQIRLDLQPPFVKGRIRSQADRRRIPDAVGQARAA